MLSCNRNFFHGIVDQPYYGIPLIITLIAFTHPKKNIQSTNNKFIRSFYCFDKLRIRAYLSKRSSVGARWRQRQISDPNAAESSKWIPSLTHKMQTKCHFRCLTHKLMQNKAYPVFIVVIYAANRQWIVYALWYLRSMDKCLRVP